MDNKKNGIPKLRFPGFTGAWEQRKFFDNIEKVIDFRGRTPKKLGMEWSAEGYTALSALNVKDGYIDFTADVHYANQDLYDKWMAGNELYKGQVLFTTEAPMGNVAQVPDNRKYVLSQRTIAFNVDKTKVTNDFLAVLLRSQNVQHTLKSLASGGTAQGVSQKSLSQLKVILPINPKEQQEIGNFFNHFDSLITLHQRKLEHLQEQKKGLLQKMFPKNGEVVPEVRFPGFTDAWEQRKLGEITSHRGGTAIEKYFDENGEYKVISIGSYGLNSKYVDQNIRAKSNEITNERVVHAGELTMVLNDKTANGTIIGRSLLIENDNEYVINQRTEIITPKENFNNKFAYTLLNGPFRNKVRRIVQGGTQIYVNYSSVEKLTVFLPNIKEQEKIAEFFHDFDSLIALHQRKLEHLELMKKGLLQQMFV